VTDNSGATPYSATYSYLANSPLVSQIAFQQSTTLRMTTTKQWDYLNRLQAVSSAPSAGFAVDFSYSYNNANQRIRSTLADGSYWLYGYDFLGQATNGVKYWSDQTPVAGQQFGYAFDDIGNRTSTQAGGDQSGAGLRSANYAANSLNQYTNRTVPGAVDIMGLGFATNAVTVNGQTAYRKGEYFRQQLSVTNGSAPVWQSVTVASTGQTNVSGYEFVPQTPEQFTYDADGNLTSDGRWTYGWDAENRLVSLAANTTVGPQQSLRFEYDWQGRRIHKQVWPNAGWSGTPTNDVKFVCDGWNLLAELNATNNAVIRSYVWGNDLSGTMQGAGGVGGLLQVWSAESGVRSFVGYDGNGNVSALVNTSDGTVSAQYEYGPFGEVIRATGPMAKANPFAFQTEFYDWETDKIYWKNRYYDWSPGRWLSRDPVNEPGFNLLASVNSDKFKQNIEEQEEQGFDSDDSDNGAMLDTAADQTSDLLYAFVQNNPANLIDDLGLTVYIQAHGVALGFNHSKVTMVVGCGSRWFGKTPFVNPMLDQSGNYYATIGAGPIHHMLVSGLNRQRDKQLWRNKFSALIPDPAGMSDDDFIGKLIAANAAYPNNLPYATFPTRKGKRYNSNGYASGILLYVTGSMPPRPPHTPGFKKPVPASEF